MGHETDAVMGGGRAGPDVDDEEATRGSAEDIIMWPEPLTAAAAAVLLSQSHHHSEGSQISSFTTCKHCFLYHYNSQPCLGVDKETFFHPNFNT